MKKSVLVEIVFIAVNGGRPSTDVSVLREDIAALLPAAINYVITGDYWARLKNDGDREIPNDFVTELEFDRVCEDKFNRVYVDIDYPLVNVAGNGGVRYVKDVAGNTYAPIPLGSYEGGFWGKALKHNLEYTRKNKKIYFTNKPELSTLFLIGVIIDSSMLKDDDELPIPAGSEPDVIDMLKNFYSNQKMNPKDYVINGVDPINEVR